MTKIPSVSVIVPMYKVERYIKKCVDSILAQTFQDFEIILVDDASPDGCVELCQKFYGDNEKVRLVRHEKNLGLGPARNTGMKHAVGKYIYFVDSDDLILPDALEKFFNVAERTNAQVVHAAGRYELEQDEPLPVREENLKIEWDRFDTEGFLPNNVLYRLEEHWKNYATWPMAWLCFCRRDFLEKNRIKFLNIISEDETFSFALLCVTERYYIMHEALYIYRKRSGSIMMTKSTETLTKRINGMIPGSAYIKKFLERLPNFKGREKFCERMLNEFFDRFVRDKTTPYYEKLTVSPQVNSAVAEPLRNFFGDGESFARFFFNHYHLFRWQSEILLQQRNQIIAQAKTLQQQNQRLSNDISSLFNRMELSPRKIVFVNFMGRGYGCNPKYIAEEILRRNLPWDLVWLVKNPAEPMPEKIRKIVYDSVDSVYELATAKVIISNTKNLLPFPRKKDGQFFVMTWHGGTGFKHIEKDAEETLSPRYLTESKANSAITDLMMVCSHEQLDEFRRAFWYTGEILNVGLPRNDIFFRRDDELVARVRKNLNVPPENKIAMYAPTFRDDKNSAAVYKFDAKKFLDALQKKFGGEWTLLIRFHPNIANTDFAKKSFDGGKIVNATNYPDMQELIAVSDVLVSDYSSVIYDFTILRKPVFIFAKDFNAYTKERGFKQLYFDLPYKICRTEEELFNCVETFDGAEVESAMKKFLDKVKPSDNGHASEIVVDKIKAVVENGQVTSPSQKVQSQAADSSVELFRQCLANPIFRKNIEYLMNVPIQEKDAQNIMKTLDFVADKYFYEMRDEQPWRPKILDVPTCIDELLASGKSLCRLGDGECKLIKGIPLDFQECDERLAQKLLQILSEPQTDCYVGLPRYYWYIRDDIERNSNPYHKRYYTFNIPPFRKFFAEHCDESKTYVDACLGGYMSNKSLEFCAERFKKLKMLFNGRKVLVVAGETVFKNITHDFFDGATQKELLLAPRINAWRHFDEIFNKILTYPEDMIVALILGPTATVLAYELSKRGRIAYDIGHLPKDYDAFMKNADRSSAAVQKFFAAD